MGAAGARAPPGAVGDRPADAPAFITAQLAGAAAATALFRWLAPTLPDDAAAIFVLPHDESETKRKRNHQ